MSVAPAPHAFTPRWLAHPSETALASAALGVYYTLTMSRDMGFYDSPELALVAVQGGVGHPIGQPLHTLLGHWLVGLGGLFSIPPLVCLNWLSALASALIVVPVVSVLDRVAPCPPGWVARSRPFVVALVGVHASLWEPASRIEVYPLGTLLGALSLSCLLPALDASRDTSRTRRMALAGLLLALTSGANAVTAFIFAVAMSPLVLVPLVRRTLPLKALAPAVGAAVVGLLVWVYVPLAARDPDVVAWGRPSDWPALRAYLSGADYQGKSVALWSAAFADNIGAFVTWSARVGLLSLPVLGVLGVALRARRLLLPVVVLLGLNVAWYARYDPFAPGVLDYLGYLGAPLWFSAGGAALLAEWAHSRSRAVHLGVLLTLVAVIGLASPGPHERTRAYDRVTRVLAEAALAELPRNAVLLVESDHSAGALMYLQEVERARPDAVVIPLGLASSSWLWELVYRRHPDLRPFALRGDGGRNARVRRFLDAHPERPRFATDQGLALRVGSSSCVAGVLLALSPCSDRTSPDGLLPLLQVAHGQLGNGAPGTAGLMARVAEERAMTLAVEGRAREALRLLTFTLDPLDLRAVPERVPPFLLPSVDEPTDGLGSERRNLLRAAELAIAANQPALATQLRSRAEIAPR